MANNMDKLAKELRKELLASDERKPKPYDTQAEVIRVEDGTAWVHIPGGVEETPVKLTIDANKGDTVNVHVANGDAWITGNGSRPPTDNAVAYSATQLANEALNGAREAKNAAENAEAEAARASTAAENAEADAANAAISAGNAATSASGAATSASNAATSASNAATAASTAAGDATRAANAADSAEADAERAETASQKALTSLANMEDVVGVLEWITAHGTMTLTSDTQIDPSHVYFVQDRNGDYVVGGQHYSIVSEPDVTYISKYYELDVDESIQNYVATHVAVDAEGLWMIPDSGGNKVLIATGAGSSYTTAGTYIIGKVNGVDTVFAKFTTDGATMKATNSTQIAHLGYGEGKTESSIANAPYYSLGKRGTATETYSSSKLYEVGDLCIYNGREYVCKQRITTQEAFTSSHWATPIIGAYSTVEGEDCVINDPEQGTTTIIPISASGYTAHAEGCGTVAIGNYSHAEGYLTHAIGRSAHAEGSSTDAIGDYSHASGYGSEANGQSSHAQNRDTIANGTDQTALGRYNVADTTSAVIIGNGTASNARSNALTIDWNGNVVPAGQIKTSFKSSIAMGSYGSAQTTVPNLVGEVRFSSGCMGSASIGTAYTSGNITIPTGWYNFIYTPHRSGGKNGSADGDNCNYGNLLLFSMTMAGSRYVIRVAGGSISEVVQILDSGSGIGKTTWTPTSGSSYSNYGGCYYEKYGRVVHVHVGVSGLTTGTSTNIYTLPSGYRPSSPVYAHGTGGAWNNIGYLEISTAGVVTVRSQGTYCGADITYLV